MSDLQAEKLHAHEVLQEAVATMQKRAKQRDTKQERSMAKTVAIFNAWTGSQMSEADGWRFMLCLKQAREIQGAFHRDDYVDLSAYAGLLAEHLAEEDAKTMPAAKTGPNEIPQPSVVLLHSDWLRPNTEQFPTSFPGNIL